ncbi:MAG: (4Fe-4S)-binding protein [Solirubrobacterales bacterium]
MKEYRTDDIIIYWDPLICSHAGKCTEGLPQVFDLNQRPWVNVNGASAEAIIAVIDRCPSQALQYALPEGSKVDPSKAKGVGSVDHIKENPPVVKIRTVANGPLLIEGPTVIHGPGGALLKEGARFTLCRCGLSYNRPFCDGTHHKEGWVEGGLTRNKDTITRSESDDDV